LGARLEHPIYVETFGVPTRRISNRSSQMSQTICTRQFAVDHVAVFASFGVVQFVSSRLKRQAALDRFPALPPPIDGIFVTDRTTLCGLIPVIAGANAARV
jgi:hypothetical protein